MARSSIISANKLGIIKQAAAILKNGGLVVFPTETVYGIGANATDEQAISRIFEAKNRPQFNPLITHVIDVVAAKELAIFDQRAMKVAERFWPGPLTMILSKKKECNISSLVTAGLDTIAIRIPNHLDAMQLLIEFGGPIAAPSANISGKISATTPAHVMDGLGSKVDMIIAGGRAEVGLESTVLDLSGKEAVILRPGAITSEDLEPIIGKVSYKFDIVDKPKSPGLLLKHYAPSIPVRLNAIDIEAGEALLAFGSDKFMGIRGGGAAYDLPDAQRMNLSKESDLYEAASNLFAMLRALDKPEYKGIAVMAIPNENIGIAINDRLKRASQA